MSPMLCRVMGGRQHWTSVDMGTRRIRCSKATVSRCPDAHPAGTVSSRILTVACPARAEGEAAGDGADGEEQELQPVPGGQARERVQHQQDDLVRADQPLQGATLGLPKRSSASPLLLAIAANVVRLMRLR